MQRDSAGCRKIGHGLSPSARETFYLRARFGTSLHKMRRKIFFGKIRQRNATRNERSQSIRSFRFRACYRIAICWIKTSEELWLKKFQPEKRFSKLSVRRVVKFLHSILLCRRYLAKNSIFFTKKSKIIMCGRTSKNKKIVLFA